MRFHYKPAVLVQLERHGVAPREDTQPDLVHDFVNALYLIEIRSLRKKAVSGEISRSDYAGSVRELRARYPILSLPVQYWLAELSETRPVAKDR